MRKLWIIFRRKKLAAARSETGRLSQLPNRELQTSPNLVLRDCPLCLRVAVLAAKGCHERRYRIYCDASSYREASLHDPHPTDRLVAHARGSGDRMELDHDVSPRCFPDQVPTEKAG
ncbi:MAG: hypothetical protein IPP19_13120 [Verrucomicrobia bacterium]|nr:hypothetical protein [Verrucomicrobiota bacterium]